VRRAARHGFEAGCRQRLCGVARRFSTDKNSIDERIILVPTQQRIRRGSTGRCRAHAKCVIVRHLVSTG
jgi:hypothetical protein